MTLIGAFSLCLTAAGFAQGRRFETLRANVSQAQAMRGVIEIRAQWTDAATAQRAGVEPLRTLSRQAKVGAMRRERRPEVSPEHLILVLVDQRGSELDWRLIRDPRVVRAEAVDASGGLSRVPVERDSTELLFSIPDLPGATAVRIFEPLPSGDGYSLSLVGEIVLTTP